MAIFKVYFFEVEELNGAVDEVFSKLEWKNQIGRNDSVLLKPNFLKEPRTGVTTDLALVRAVVEKVKDRTANVYVGETDSTGKDFDRLAGKLDLGCKVVNLSKGDTVLVSGRYGKYRLPGLALKSKIINLPVLKTHLLTKVSLGVKNLFGLIQDKQKDLYHWKLDEVLYDLYHIFKPPMNLLDALYIMDGRGPLYGRIRKTNLLAASSNTLALDAATCRFVGLNPSEVGHLKRLRESERVEYEMVGKFKLNMEFNVPDTRLPRIADSALCLLKRIKSRLFCTLRES